MSAACSCIGSTSAVAVTLDARVHGHEENWGEPVPHAGLFAPSPTRLHGDAVMDAPEAALGDARETLSLRRAA